MKQRSARTLCGIDGSAALRRAATGDLVAAFAISLVALATALIPDLSAKGTVIAVTVMCLAFSGVCQHPRLWLYVFFAADLLLPPLPGTVGSPAVHIAPALVGLGVFAAILQRREWRLRNTSMLLAFGIFTFSLMASVPFAAIYSGTDLATASAARIALFLVGGYVFAETVCGPRMSAAHFRNLSRFLFVIAVLAAAFACVDFFFHFPAPAGFSDQYVWLSDGVFRRAQGLFYDASTLGNFCAFFLFYALITLAERRQAGRIGRILVVAGALTLGAALMLSYSRASLLNVAIGMVVYAILRREKPGRILVASLAAGAIAAIAIQLVFPTFAANYWSRVFNTVRYFGERPDGVLSGRLTNWQILTDFIASHPWQAVFGIGYKTLPYTSYLGDPVIADNTYLSLLIETGIAGLGTFFVLLGLILRTSFRAAKSLHADASFVGKWTFCFWCGQTAQMMSGDLLTYWRVLPVYFWAIGAATRALEARE